MTRSARLYNKKRDAGVVAVSLQEADSSCLASLARRNDKGEPST
jgi:hypothetical protein